MNQTEQSELAASRARVKELEAALSHAKLQISALELTIDVAEKELEVDIRKKSGSRS